MVVKLVDVWAAKRAVLLVAKTAASRAALLVDSMA